MNKLKCNNCGSYKLTRTSNVALYMALGLIFFGALTVIFLIGVPFLVIGAIILFIWIVMRLTGVGDKFVCQGCHKSFTIKEASLLK